MLVFNKLKNELGNSTVDEYVYDMIHYYNIIEFHIIIHIHRFILFVGR